jgi:hypothetical protein
VSSAVSQARERGWERRAGNRWFHAARLLVCRRISNASVDRAGWYWWPVGASPHGPYRTMTEAMDAAEKGAGDGSDK